MSGPAAGAFSAWERGLAVRYLMATRKEAGVALITLLAFIAVAIAVAALIIVMSVMGGFRSELLGRMLGVNGHIYVTGAAINAPDRDALLSRLRATPGVISAVPQINAPVMVVGPSQSTGGILKAQRPADVAANRLVADHFVDGSLRGFGQGEYGGDVIAIGSRLAQGAGVRAGDEMSLITPSGAATAFGSTPTRKSYVVGGLFSVGVSEYDQALIYMPLEQAQLFLGRGDSIDEIEIKVKNPDDIDPIRARVQQAAGPYAQIADWRDRNAGFFNALRVERATMRLIFFIAVALALINIVSGLIMLAKTKTRDIAVLRTMGARRGSVLRIFVMTGMMIGVAGSVVGVLLGTLFCVFIDPIQSVVERVSGVPVFSPDTYFLNRIPARVEPGEVALVLGVTLLMSLLATLPPAWRASRLDPVEALRYE